MRCPEGERRAKLPDAEFWSEVLGVQEFQEEDLDHEIDPPEMDFSDGCGVCGETSVCGYDGNGYAWVHADGLKSAD